MYQWERIKINLIKSEIAKLKMAMASKDTLQEVEQIRRRIANYNLKIERLKDGYDDEK